MVFVRVRKKINITTSSDPNSTIPWTSGIGEAIALLSENKEIFNFETHPAPYVNGSQTDQTGDLLGAYPTLSALDHFLPINR